ncbi:MAG: transglutaminase family protein, partial [Dehalococcoidia bacterium]
LRPLTDEHQSCLSFSLTTVPHSEPRPYTDYYGNTVYHFDIPESHARLEIVADADVMTQERDLAQALAADDSPRRPLSQADRDRWLDFLSETPLTAAGNAVRLFSRSIGEGQETWSGLARAIAERIHAALQFRGGVTDVTTTADDALGHGVGVCQDFTHLFLAVSRLHELPARYVSGYLSTGAGAEEIQASHAWAEVLLPRAGWIGFDAANGRLADSRYVRIAIGRDYADVPPVRGAFSGSSGAGVDVAVFVVSDQQQ